ncbi:MAG: hypothetical protein PHO23_02790, partial [Candidatus Pacebacteria bacterium]|nr:hypothetical protein [Candidatus Paceibacterota bacterium]
MVSGLKQEVYREGINNNLYDIYLNQLRVVESLCESLPKQVGVNVETENTFEYVGYEKVSNSLVLVKIKADVKNKDVGITLKIGEGSKRYTFSSTGIYELRVYYDIFDGTITSVEAAKIS